MSSKSRRIHKETATTVFTGLLINYPLNLLGLFICIDKLGMTSSVQIGTTITAWMTLNCIYTCLYHSKTLLHYTKHCKIGALREDSEYNQRGIYRAFLNIMCVIVCAKCVNIFGFMCIGESVNKRGLVGVVRRP